MKSTPAVSSPCFEDMTAAWALCSPHDQPWSATHHIIRDILDHATGHTVADNGPGNGEVISGLAGKFTRFWLLDHRTSVLKTATEKLRERKTAAKNIHALKGNTFLQSELFSQQNISGDIDLLLNVHNFHDLVYHPNAQQNLACHILWSLPLLSHNGKMLVVLNHPLEGDASLLFSHFTGQRFSLDLEKIYRQWVLSDAISVDLKKYTTEIRTPHLHEIILCALMILLHNEGIPEYDFSDRIEEIEQYIQQFYDPATGEYCMQQVQWHLWVGKKK